MANMQTLSHVIARLAHHGESAQRPTTNVRAEKGTFLDVSEVRGGPSAMLLCDNRSKELHIVYKGTAGDEHCTSIRWHRYRLEENETRDTASRPLLSERVLLRVS